MKIHFLQGSSPLTKSYKQTAQGIEKSSYPHMFEVTSHEVEVADLAAFETALKAHAKKGHCLLKGELSRPLVKESRAGTTDRNGTTQWICLDLDGLPTSFEVTDQDSKKHTVKYDIDVLLDAMGMGNISYILQWSASHGIGTTNDIRAHVIMLLDRPVSVPLIKQWLIEKNHSTPILRANTSLTKTACSLSWVLDITACQNDKLIYIAPPVLKGLADPLGKAPRIKLVKKAKAKFVFPQHVASIATNRELTDKRIHELREAAGMPKRKLNYKLNGPHEIMVKPDASIVTDMKAERGFVYFNLNGGDSWAYYHPENNPEYILNFKGEPVYLTKELLPEYWAQICSTASRTDSNGITYLAFCDRATSTYWRGTYNGDTDELELYHAKTETILRHFAGQYGVPLGDDIPEWDRVFDPYDNVRVDFNNRTVNLFQLTKYMKAVSKPTKVCPPTIFKVIHNATGSDPAITEHFMNWLAFILQRRAMTRTSWVLHGVPGTGKGILINKILRPLFGHSQTAVKRLEEFNEQYNDYMRNCFLVFVDEFQVSALNNEKGVMAKIKNFITEPQISLRAMYQGAVEADNYTNWIFASNETDSMVVAPNDRRTNVAAYQTEKLEISNQEIDQIERELQAFHDYLLHFSMDEDAAHTPLDNEERNMLIGVSTTSLEATAAAIREGSMEFLVDQLPTDNKYQSNALLRNRTEDYKGTLKDIIQRTNPTTGMVHISRDELFAIFDYCNEKVPSSPSKFTKLLQHHRIKVAGRWINNRTVRGITVTWQDLDKFDQYVKDHFPTPPKEKAKTK